MSLGGSPQTTRTAGFGSSAAQRFVVFPEHAAARSQQDRPFPSLQGVLVPAALKKIIPQFPKQKTVAPIEGHRSLLVLDAVAESLALVRGEISGVERARPTLLGLGGKSVDPGGRRESPLRSLEIAGDEPRFSGDAVAAAEK